MSLDFKEGKGILKNKRAREFETEADLFLMDTRVSCTVILV
jgi:hypothetical protein